MEYLAGRLEKIAIENSAYWLKVVELEKNRITKLSDIKEDWLFFQPTEYAKEMLLWKPARPSGGKEPSLENTKKHLEEIVKLLNGLDESEFRADKIKETIWNYAEKKRAGAMFFGRCASL